MISRAHPEPEIRRIAIKVVDEIVRPMVDLDVDETEYACLKAIVFFNPGKKMYSIPFCKHSLAINENQQKKIIINNRIFIKIFINHTTHNSPKFLNVSNLLKALHED